MTVNCPQGRSTSTGAAGVRRRTPSTVAGGASLRLLVPLLAASVLCGAVAEEKMSSTHSVGITDEAGVMLEQQVASRVDVVGMRFPSRLSDGDWASFEFETTDTRGLLFHADSEDGRHEITAWIDGGAVKVRLAGWCLWLKLGEVLWDDVDVSDGNVHKFAIHSRRNGGIRFRVDDRNELAFFHTSRAVFSCWHVDNFYFGGPGPKRFYAENNSESEYSYKMSSCIKNLSVNSSAVASPPPRFSYYRVSSCPRRGFASADVSTLRRHRRPLSPSTPPHLSQLLLPRHLRSSNTTATASGRPAAAYASAHASAAVEAIV